MRVGIDRNGLVTFLDPSSIAALSVFEELRVDTIGDAAYHAAQIPKWRMQQQMVVVAHPIVDMRFDAEERGQITEWYRRALAPLV